MKHFIDELRRRNVHRVAIAYVTGSWLLIQVVETLFPVFGLPDAAIRTVVILLAAGFVPAVILSWSFEWTGKGLRRESDAAAGQAAPAATRRFDRAIMVLLALAVTYLVVDKFVFTHDQAPQRLDSIAVLAFEDLSPQHDQAWFAEGISEELLNLLAAVPELRVAARTSAFSFRDKDATVAEIGKALGVAHVIEGSVRRFDNRIRITVQLIDARSDTHQWSQTYDREFVDVFDIQDEIARSVVDQLRLGLLGQVPTAKRVDPDAYPLYLQARSLLNGDFDDADFSRAVQLLERALEIDPDFVDALSILARARWLGGFGDEARTERYARVRAMVDRGLALDPDSGAMLGWKAFLTLVLDNDSYTAARYTERAHEVDPTNYELIWGTMSMASLYGRPQVGIELGKYILVRDPLCLGCYGDLADTYLETGDYAAAEATLRKGLELDPDYIGLRIGLGQALLLQGRAQEALEIYTQIQREYDATNPGRYAGFPGHLETLHELGRSEEFDALLPVYLEFHEREGYETLIAQLYAWLGDKDRAFEWLAKHDREMTWNIRIHLTRPWYRKLHDDPRWQALLEQYQMTRADFDAINLTIRMPPDMEHAAVPAVERP